MLNNPPMPDFQLAIKPNITRWVMPGWYFSAQVATPLLVNNQITYCPIFVNELTNYIRVGAEVLGLAAGGTVDIRLFSCENGLPYTLLHSFGTISTNAVALVEITININLARGYYFLAHRPDAAAAGATLSGILQQEACSFPASGIAPTQGAAAQVLMNCLAAYADPAPAPTGLIGVNSAAIFLREN